ncbi:MAG: hypothetical protein ACXV3F_00395 [Frankiaceae bacterium]
MNWADGSGGGTPLSAANLNKLAVVADAATSGTPTGDAFRAAYGRRRMYDVRDYVGTDDMGAAINRAISAAASDAYSYGKPGQVVLPPMNAAVTTEIVPMNGVDVIGSGWGKTILRPQGQLAAFHLIGSTSSPLHDVLFANFEIDGSDQTGTYAVGGKGFYIQYLLRVNFDNLYIHDTMATGLGCDFFQASWIRNVTANNCGRLNGGSNPGGAGIGIGTGAFPTGGVEDVLVENCTTNSNGRCGLFFETQSGQLYQGVKVANHHAVSNGEHGIADAGCDGLQVMGGYVRANGKSGFAAYSGTIGATAVPGKNGRIIGLQAQNNSVHGLVYDNSVNEGAGAYQFIDCYANGNTQQGISLIAKTTALTNMRVSGARSRANGNAGIRITTTGTGTFTDLSLLNNETYGNGTATSYGGVSIGASVTNLRIQGGRSGNSGGTTQQYGIDLQTGVTLTNGSIDGIDCSDNLTSAFNVAGTMSGTRLGWISSYNVRSGAPEGVVTAPIGTLYRRTDGGAATTFYVKESGTGSSGWVAK